MTRKLACNLKKKDTLKRNVHHTITVQKPTLDITKENFVVSLVVMKFFTIDILITIQNVGYKQTWYYIVQQENC